MACLLETISKSVVLELEFRTCSNESLTSVIAFVFSEVLDEACSQILSFLFPLASAIVCVARIEDVRINTLQLCRNNEVEVRYCLCRSSVD